MHKVEIDRISGAGRRRLYHEQLGVRVFLKVNGRPPNFDPPHRANTIGEIELEIGRINYLGCLTKQVKFHICNPSGIVWAMG